MPMTKRRISLLIFGSILFFVLLFVGRRFYYVFYEAKGCDEVFMMDRKDRYFWLFDSSKASLLKCEYSLGNDSAKKYRFIYTYNNQFTYLIVEDDRLNGISLDRISDTLNRVSSFEVYMDPSEVNDWHGGRHIYFQSKICIDSSNGLIVNLGEPFTKFKNDSLRTLYFKGVLKNVLFQNESIENQYLVKYDNPTPTTILFYKPQNILYLIIINPFNGVHDTASGICNLSIK